MFQAILIAIQKRFINGKNLNPECSNYQGISRNYFNSEIANNIWKRNHYTLLFTGITFLRISLIFFLFSFSLKKHIFIKYNNIKNLTFQW